MSHTFSGLTTFDEKLKELKPEFEQRMKAIEDKSKEICDLDNLVKSFISTNGKDFVTIDVGGKQFKTTFKTLLSKKDSFFYVNAYECLKLGKSVSNSYFFDRKNELFSLVLDYLRTGVLHFEGMKELQIKYFSEELKYYGIWQAYAILEKFLSKAVIIGFTASPKYSTAGNYSIEKIDEPNNSEGICVQSPYEIVFELNYIHEVTSLEIKGYTGNSSLWGSSNGENCPITVSTDKTKWDSVGTIPSGFGNEVKKLVFKQSKQFKYIKFKHNSYLGISYLRLLKN